MRPLQDFGQKPECECIHTDIWGHVESMVWVPDLISSALLDYVDVLKRSRNGLVYNTGNQAVTNGASVWHFTVVWSRYSRT